MPHKAQEDYQAYMAYMTDKTDRSLGRKRLI